MNNGIYWQEKPTTGTEYPEDFKIKVVREVESGLFSQIEAKRKYGIGGKSTVLYWLRQYGREDYPYMAAKKKRKIKPLDNKDKRIAELEAKLAQKEVAIGALEALIEVANEMYGTDLKKKVGLKRSKR